MPANPTPTSIAPLVHMKWWLFRLLESISDLRGNSADGHLELAQPERPLPSLWVFVSTIGELNAIDPLLREIIARVPQLKLVLITDHPHYRDSYVARYPNAEVCVTRGHAADATALAKHYPPELLVVAEIPCWPSDAPCRFSFAFLLAAKRANAITFLVNAWLYHYAPPSRMDVIERSLFQKDYLRTFDAIGVQTNEMRHQLLAAGADPTRIAVTGNIKFDAMQQPNWSPNQARSPAMLGALINSARPVIVAGCITNFAEQEMVLDAFITVRTHHPQALLILAPRHPEVMERMQVLRDYLAKRDLPAAFRSAQADQPIATPLACMVLDTMGELRDFYAAATVAHVGVDHNVLEPLGFGKPVTVNQGWNTTYPSYPVYRLLMDAQALIEVTTAEQLSTHWLHLMDNANHYRQHIHAISETLTQTRGAVKRHLTLLTPLMPSHL
jgi:3-deoxy-D-manno-octulosonic-acid transferase